MSSILKGKIKKNKNNDCLIEYWDYKMSVDPLYSGEYFKLTADSELLELEDGDFVEFYIKKLIFADKIELLARVYRIIDDNWDQVFEKFEKSSEIIDLNEFKKFLSENYEIPKKKLKKTELSLK
jgi:hypothetical protein